LKYTEDSPNSRKTVARKALVAHLDG
jgi:hypothetical protein